MIIEGRDLFPSKRSSSLSLLMLSRVLGASHTDTGSGLLAPSHRTAQIHNDVQCLAYVFLHHNSVDVNLDNEYGKINIRAKLRWGEVSGRGSSFPCCVLPECDSVRLMLEYLEKYHILIKCELSQPFHNIDIYNFLETNFSSIQSKVNTDH